MIIDFTTVLTDQDNRPVKDPVDQNVDFTLGRAAAIALNGTFQDEQNLTGEEKFNRGYLAQKIRDAKDCDLKAEDVTLIKKVIGKAFNPIVVYQTYKLLDK